ncbi:hypothetical protein AJ80_08329 [Polytolypa hystricis UAMH7299]|uniref:SH3 domain-containing protein n=1 Tax=Polytolypa hystricis (strain UAMH7299) TaxID=1447883 RepID=A0A2B7XA32_POLH7|nr:hypothetical protein AJ80_08329 [Polytolypa hystricis UAMH7299]
MAATIHSSASAPPEFDSSTPLPTISPLPPLSTSPAVRRTNSQRPPSYAAKRMSAYSTASFNSQNRSRPVSHAFPVFHSSLPYALVRDFAYPPIHPLHYGPLPDSGISTPASEPRRLSDPQPSSWDTSRGHWSSESWDPEAMYGNQQLPAVAFGDGPPYSEDEDLHSPVVTTSRHRKHKSSYSAAYRSDSRRGRSPGPSHGVDSDRGTFVSINRDGSETYYVKDDDAVDDGPGGEYVTYPASEGRYSYLRSTSFEDDGQGNPAYDKAPIDADMELESDDEISDDGVYHDTSRYSRDYQFTIVSPDEEMHGKAVALFDFTREHENELPLKEGQVILVSYRHGQGWLVAEDPKTGESGLVPEEFVRLVRDIEGGLTSLNGALLTTSLDGDTSGQDSADTPTQEDHSHFPPSDSQPEPVSNGATNADDQDTSSRPSSKEKPNERDKHKEREKHPPVVSTFSTSRSDLDPYPLAGHQHRKSTPPQIEHYGHLSGNGNVSSGRSNSISRLKTHSGSG